MQNITQTVLDNLNVEQGIPVNKELYKKEIKSLKNEFLLILKPELFANTNKQQISAILNFIFSKLSQYNFQISNARLINAAYLKQYGIMDKHYGLINAAARHIKATITTEAINTFEQIYQIDFSTARVFGALELLEQKTLTPQTLSSLWKACEIKRLSSGIYSGKVQFNGRNLYIINGFHPPQLEHFIADGRLIITMNISSDTSWKIARQEMTGNTYPEKASTESIRGALYKQYGKFGFDNVSYVLNSIHLSAGPLEGLLELQRFNSTFEKNEEVPINDFSFGKMLTENFTKTEIEKICSNPMVNYKGKTISLFDLTEELNCDKALKLFIELKSRSLL